MPDRPLDRRVSERRPTLADQFLEAAAAARTGSAVDEVSRLPWRAHAEHKISDADAKAISEAVQTRRAAQAFFADGTLGPRAEPRMYIIIARENKVNNTHPYLISFTDLIYAALLGYSLTLLEHAVTDASLASIGFIVTAIILMIYDWYGEHWLAVQQRVGGFAIVFDFFALMIYFGLFLSGARVSGLFMPLLALRALRGIVYNCVLLSSVGDPGWRETLKSFNISSSLMAITYTAVAFIDATFQLGR